jgi:hypothetical protein
LEKSSTYSHTWLGINPQIGRPLSRIVGTIGLFINEGCSPNSTKTSSIYCRTYFINILSSNFSEGIEGKEEIEEVMEIL